MEKTGRCGRTEKGRGYDYSISDCLVSDIPPYEPGLATTKDMLPPFWWYSFSFLFILFLFFGS